MKSPVHLVLTVIALLEGLSGLRVAIGQETNSGDLYQKAQALAQEGKLSDAEEPLNSLLAQENDRVAQLLFFRASLRAQMGRFQDAARDFEQVIKIDPSNHSPWFNLTPLLVRAGEIPEYRTNCKEMLRRFSDTTEAPIANRIAKSCLLIPSALDPEDVITAAKLADKSVALTKEGEFWPWRSMTQGLAEYRRGGFARASELTDRFEKEMHDAEQAGTLPGDWSTCKADACFISAMAHQQLKETSQAQAALARGRVIVRAKLPDLSGKDLGSAWCDVLWTYILMSEASKTVEASVPGQP
jgi:tetratricopeptide (TPR) repeat protein